MLKRNIERIARESTAANFSERLKAEGITLCQLPKGWGVTVTLEEDKDKYEALALGGTGNGVTNLELTSAYSVIARGGEYKEPVFNFTVFLYVVPAVHRHLPEYRLVKRLQLLLPVLRVPFPRRGNDKKRRVCASFPTDPRRVVI